VAHGVWRALPKIDSYKGNPPRQLFTRLPHQYSQVGGARHAAARLFPRWCVDVKRLPGTSSTKVRRRRRRRSRGRCLSRPLPPPRDPGARRYTRSITTTRAHTTWSESARLPANVLAHVRPANAPGQVIAVVRVPWEEVARRTNGPARTAGSIRRPYVNGPARTAGVDGWTLWPVHVLAHVQPGQEARSVSRGSRAQERC